jgi:hypothetical protein
MIDPNEDEDEDDSLPEVLAAMKREYFKRALQEDRVNDDAFSYAVDQLQDAIIQLQEELNEDPIPETTGIL